MLDTLESRFRPYFLIGLFYGCGRSGSTVRLCRPLIARRFRDVSGWGSMAAQVQCKISRSLPVETNHLIASSASIHVLNGHVRSCDVIEPPHPGRLKILERRVGKKREHVCVCQR